MERSGGVGAETGAGTSKDATYAEGSGHAIVMANIGAASGTPKPEARRCADTVAGTASATAAGATLQHDAAWSDAGASGEPMGHASQLEPDADVIGIGQTSRSPARGAAPVTTKEKRRKRPALRRIRFLVRRNDSLPWTSDPSTPITMFRSDEVGNYYSIGIAGHRLDVTRKRTYFNSFESRLSLSTSPPV